LNGASVQGPLPEDLSGPDAWIVSRLNQVITEVDDLYERFEFAKAADLLYHFAWDEVCDWYLELAKITLADSGAEVTRRVLGQVLDVLLRLLHPMIPFATEVLWTALTGGESVVIAAWPQADSTRIDEGATRDVAEIQAVVVEVRRFRSDQGVKPAQKVPARLTGAGRSEAAIRALVRLDTPGDTFTPTATLTTANGVVVEFDLSAAIDVSAERSRLRKDLDAARKEFEVNSRKLGDQAFLAKAPAPVVEKVRARLAAAEADIDRIEAALSALP
jgi:valyl-tRNA synthetase